MRKRGGGGRRLWLINSQQGGENSALLIEKEIPINENRPARSEVPPPAKSFYSVTLKTDMSSKLREA